ncbi:MAG: glucose-1-phosphate cytidylyltransferase [Alphaproteobacteria bacterium]
MKCVILAGGLGSRLSEETNLRPKPMVEIGDKPILWHIMKIYSAHGINDFVVCLGYKGYVIKEYFANYFLHMADVTVDLNNNSVQVHQNSAEPWRITMVETGQATDTGGRLLAVRRYIEDEESFCFTYGDGLCDVDITKLVAFHKEHGKLATVTATRPPGRFGSLGFNGDQVSRFEEKPIGDGGWINGGYFVLKPKVLDYIENASTIWERQPMEKLSREGQLMAYRHEGYWQAMDTLREKHMLADLWASGKAPWMKWAA